MEQIYQNISTTYVGNVRRQLARRGVFALFTGLIGKREWPIRALEGVDALR
ncbi:Uncharacterised protein [Mycobacteroides abscessus subsp. massiliense]|nr:Uncharacterised protein [Mycobacteroides abscessus subsp. massiliense]